MKRVLNKLRERNDGEKKVISLALSAVLTFVIVSLWLSFDSSQVQAEKITEIDDIYTSGPLQDLKDGFIKVLDSIK